MENKSNKKQRIITGTIFSLIAVLCLYIHPLTFHLLESILMLIMIIELNQIFKANKLDSIINYCVFIISQILCLINIEMNYEIFPLLSFFIYMIYSLYTHDILKSIQFYFSSIYSIYLLSFSLGISKITQSQFTTLYVIFLVCLNDGCQYAFGRLFGKHRPFTYLSPNKSIEGYLGGLFVLLMLSFIAEENIIFMICVYCISIIGDLIASCLKRQLDIKDFGNILPGMGGMLDRLDSIIVVMAFAYHWFKYVGYHPGTIIRCIQHYLYFSNDQCPF